MKVVTAEEMHEIDRKTIEEIGIPGLVLMENAGRAVFREIQKMVGDLKDKNICIFAGKGNNGGDGLVAARHLHNAGAEVKVFLLGKSEELKGDAKTNLEIAKRISIKIKELRETQEFLNEAASCTQSANIIIDAIFGTGFQGEVQGLTKELINIINETPNPVVSVDVPSGLHSNTGQIGGVCVKATKTVTFGLPKIGLLIYPGAEYAGEVIVAEIGIPREFLESEALKINLITSDLVTSLLPFPRPPQTHKGDFGHVFVLSGSVGMTGAAAMTSQAALRIGAGLVTLGIPKSLNEAMEVKLTEVMTKPLPETEAQSLSLEALPIIKEFIARSDVLAIGPGISLHPETSQLVRQLLSEIEVPTVVDADGLTALSEDVSLFKKIKIPVVITPHPGEMSRLLKKSVSEIQSNRLGVAQKAAKEFGSVVVLKGARTIVAHPTGTTFINPTGNPGMASGGVGDVLTGMVAGLLAQKLSPLNASILAVYLHGLAGDLAAQEKGQLPLIASDLMAMLPEAIKKVRKNERD